MKQSASGQKGETFLGQYSGQNPTSTADTVNRWWHETKSGIVTLCWITNWFIQSHWPTDDARCVRIWEWWPSIWGPYWQRHWGTLPYNDTNSSSWVSNHVLPEQKSTILTLQKLAGRTLRVNGIRWPEKHFVIPETRPRRQTQSEELPSGFSSKFSFFLCAQPFLFHKPDIRSPSDNVPKSFHNYDPWDHTIYPALVLISYWFQLFEIYINQRGTVVVKFH
jgi:hypothetical protein